MRRELKILLLSLIFVALTGATALATTIDLTGAGTTATGTAAVGGTFVVSNMEMSPTGTGVLDSFLRIQQTGQERGYNTDASPVPLDDKAGAFTHSLPLGTIPTKTIDGGVYREFILDANQTGVNPFLSLNQVQIFLGPDPGSSFSLTEASASTDAVIAFSGITQVFEMNALNASAAARNEVQIDFDHGSGSGDMFLYVRDSVFTGGPDTNVVFFSQFGTPRGTYFSNDGFEEWAVRGGGVSVPEPASMLLLGSGLTGLAAFGRKRSFKKQIEH